MSVPSLLGGLAVLIGTVSTLTDPSGLAAITIAAAAVLCVLVLVQRAVPLPDDTTFVASAIRQQSARVAHLPLSDPDAPGRPRPRAPSTPAWAG
ncbi:DUF6412 domain-containing protein [Phytoactinopolyspora mesophila]|uniref:Uncharacterized protein n=1 Tax=Phytoactinopolyspora mesophila TaxID=2650750 RepID=A0A7K3MAT2_9ACTN|nr:DUF6412 domain-containing protein [Phytoactinopolyspora mesophila]NDL60147.1 hypothetical protein [Phytoactinopolyspora mesophila]